MIASGQKWRWCLSSWFLGYYIGSSHNWGGLCWDTPSAEGSAHTWKFLIYFLILPGVEVNKLSAFLKSYQGKHMLSTYAHPCIRSKLFLCKMTPILYSLTFMQSHFQPTMIWIKKIWTTSLTLQTTAPVWTIILCMDQASVWDLKLISLLEPNDGL